MMKNKEPHGTLFSRGDTSLMMIIFISILVIAICGASRTTYEENFPEVTSEPCPSPTIPVSDLPYYDLVIAASEEYGIEAARIYAVIKAESSFRETVVSKAGAIGLMQMMPDTYRDVCEDLGREYDRHDLFNPAVNIDACTYYLKRQYDRFGDWDQAHAAYNAGANKVREWLKNPDYAVDGKLIVIPYKETSRYVEKIRVFYEEYRVILDESSQ